MSSLFFYVPGPAVTWKRTATYQGRRITPKAQRDYQQRVSGAARAAVMGTSMPWPLRCRYSVDIVWVPSNLRRADIDNMAKTILDSCNGIVWEDDSRVDGLTVLRSFDHAPDPGVWVTVVTVATR